MSDTLKQRAEAFRLRWKIKSILEAGVVSHNDLIAEIRFARENPPDYVFGRENITGEHKGQELRANVRHSPFSVVVWQSAFDYMLQCLGEK